MLDGAALVKNVVTAESPMLPGDDGSGQSLRDGVAQVPCTGGYVAGTAWIFGMNDATGFIRDRIGDLGERELGDRAGYFRVSYVLSAYGHGPQSLSARVYVAALMNPQSATSILNEVLWYLLLGVALVIDLCIVTVVVVRGHITSTLSSKEREANGIEK